MLPLLDAPLPWSAHVGCHVCNVYAFVPQHSSMRRYASLQTMKGFYGCQP